MASQFVLTVLDSRDAATVTSETEPMALSTELNAAHAMNQGDAWAWCQKMSKYFGDIAVGAVSANITIMNATTSASGALTATANPAAADTVTINGTVITFVAGTPSGSQVQLGATAPETLQNLINFINRGGNAGALAGIVTAVRTAPLVVTIYATLPGTAGNAITTVESSTALGFAAGTLLGGVAVTTQHVISAGL
jgi:hypothetical protein